MAMNSDGDFEGAESFLQIEMTDFEAYCAPLPNAEELIGSIRRTHRSVRRPMRELARKEVSTAHYKSMRSMADARVNARDSSWVDYLEE